MTAASPLRVVVAASRQIKKGTYLTAAGCVEDLFSLTLRGGYIAFDGEFYVPPKAASPFHHYRGPPPPWMDGGRQVRYVLFSPCFSAL